MKYSPFKTKQELLEQFDRIDGSKGTLIVIFNMLLNSDNKPYLVIDKEKKDIIISRHDDDDGDENNLCL